MLPKYLIAHFPKMRYSSQYDADCASGTVQGVVSQYMAMEQCMKKKINFVSLSNSYKPTCKLQGLNRFFYLKWRVIVSFGSM